MGELKQFKRALSDAEVHLAQAEADLELEARTNVERMNHHKAEIVSLKARLAGKPASQPVDGISAAQLYLSTDDSEEMSLLRHDLERRAKALDCALRLQKSAEEGWLECQQRLEYEAERRRRVEALMRNLLKEIQKRSAAPSPPSNEPTPSLTEEAKDRTLSDAKSLLAVLKAPQNSRNESAGSTAAPSVAPSSRRSRGSLNHHARPKPRDSGLADIASLDGTQLLGKPLEEVRKVSISSAQRDAVNPFL